MGIAELKWFIVNNINFFQKKCKTIDNEGKLNLGFCYENYEMLEEYNSKTSPYWALKTFLIVSLKKNHLFWQTLPKIPNWNKTHLIKKINAMIVNDNKDQKYLIVSGFHAKFNPKHNLEKYFKKIYSTKYGFNLLIDGFDDADMHLFISNDQNEYFTKFKPPFKNKIKNNEVICKYKTAIIKIKSIKSFENN